MNNLLYNASIFIFVLFESFLYKNNIIIAIYKNPIFKLVFLFGIYLYGEKDIVLTLLFAMYYIYLGQKIQENELKNIFM
jgi:hypothetical protein